MLEKEKKEREYFEQRAKEEVEKQRKQKQDAIANRKREKEEAERAERHRIWKSMGQNYFNRMYAAEEKKMRAQKYEEEQEAIKLAAERKERERLLNIEREKIRKRKEEEAKKKAEEKRITRWYDTGSRYRGEWFEEANWENRTKPHRHNMHRTPHGEGEYYNEQGNLVYKGQFFNGLKHGKGLHILYDKNRPYKSFEGDFYNDLKQVINDISIIN